MRTRRLLSLLAMGTAGLIFSLPAAPVQAAGPPPWCAKIYGSEGSGYTSCDFQTREQCLATVIGVGGICHENPAAGRPKYEPGERPRSHRTREM